MTYSIIDISKWDFENKNVSGSKEKRWYRSPQNNKLALFKLPISLTSDTWTILEESSGEVWSEKICSEIGAVIGFETHRVDIASLDITPDVVDYYGITKEKVENKMKIYGCLCWSFLKEEEESLVEGADMIMEFDETYNREDLQGEKEIYNFDLLFRTFNKYDEIEELYKMVIFDTLIGNTDRHQDNFGVIRDEKTGKHRFAPLYDNSSSLGRELPIQRVQLMLKDENMFQSYIRKSSTPIRWGADWHKKRLNLFDLYFRVKNKYPQIQNYIHHIEALNNQCIVKIIDRIPSTVMTDSHKELVYKILVTRRDKLLS